MSIINTNTIALNAQRNLQANSTTLATTIQRLSSGLRINSARDDAAGLAISERFSTQIRGQSVATRNANDGISLAQTAEGALTEISNNLQRIRELAVQSTNATNSASDRAALNAEVTQLVSEIDRVARQSEFNGTRLLDGSFFNQLFQVGANAGQAIAITRTADARASQLGGARFDGFSMAFTAPTADATITGFNITDSLGNVTTLGTINIAAGSTANQVARAVAAAVNARIGETGLHATTDTTTGTVTFTSVRESVTAAGTFQSYAIDTGTGTGISVPADRTTTTVQTTGNGAGQFFADALSITTVVLAGQALSIADRALATVNGARADLGAVQNRFQSVTADLAVSVENLSAARSRIRDADYARETAELTRTQILQQAGTAMLAQANQIPQNVLALLR
jgi:flagellin